MTKIEKLEAALKWALENGINYSSPWKTSDGRECGDYFTDHGCGCCAGHVDLPKDLEDVIRAVVSKSGEPT